MGKKKKTLVVTGFMFLIILYSLQQYYINSLICLSLEICKRAFCTSVYQKQFLEFIEFIPSFPMFHQSKMADSNIFHSN